MKKCTQEIKFIKDKGSKWSPLEEIAREGARKMLQLALENEVDEFVEKHSILKDESGRRIISRNGLDTQSILIPLVRFVEITGLYNTYGGLILTHTAYGVPIATLLFKNYFDTIPIQIIESAKIDGCSNIGVFFRIILPLSFPGFAVVAIFQFTNIWNNFLYGLTLTRGVESMLLTVAITNLKGTTVAAWNIQMSGVLISMITVLLMYVFLWN